MFKGKGNMAAENSSPDQVNNIRKGTSIKGDIEAEGNFRIDGILEGNLITKAKLIIGASGSIVGDVVCKSADIEGTFSGKLVVQELLSLKSTAKVDGVVTPGQLAIQPGAHFNANCDMSKSSSVKALPSSKSSVEAV